MKHKTAKTAEWQECGGSIEIPQGWFVSGANFDVEEPYVEICSNTPGSYDEKKKIPFPKPIAYYLSTHFCGSDVMHEIISEGAKYNIQNTIKTALGL